MDISPQEDSARSGSPRLVCMGVNMKRRLAVAIATLFGASVLTGAASPAEASSACTVRATWGWSGPATYRISGTWPAGPNNFRYSVHWGSFAGHVTTFNTTSNPVTATKHTDASKIEGWANGYKCVSWLAQWP